MYVVDENVPPGGPPCDVALSSSQGMAVPEGAGALATRAPTTELLSGACQVGPAKWMAMGWPASSTSPAHGAWSTQLNPLASAWQT